MHPSSRNLHIQLLDAVDPSSYVDPHGFVFYRDDRVYRAIHRASTEFYLSLIKDGTARRLYEELGLVGTEISELSFPETDCALILSHETIEPATYCVEWPPSMLRDAARLHLELSLDLASHEMMLQDAYPWNIRFQAVCPRFIDFTSIVPADSRPLWPAYEQFESFFLRPLHLAMLKKGKLGRALLLDNINGISLEDFVRVAGKVYTLRHPLLALSSIVDSVLRRKPTLRRAVKRAAADRMPAPDKAVRQRFFHRLLARIDGMAFTDSTDVWKEYYRQIDGRADKKKKVDVLQQLLTRIAPPSVLDLGCNTGVFSVLAAQCGAQVISVDSSEACTEHLYAYAKAKRLNIQPLVANVVCPTPVFGFGSNQYPPLHDRVRSHTVLCLGLMHHLHIAGRQSFARIASMLNQLATHCVVFEYIARDDENVELIDNRRPIDYTLDTVLAALRHYFPSLSIFDSDRPTRKIVLCQHE